MLGSLKKPLRRTWRGLKKNAGKTFKKLFGQARKRRTERNTYQSSVNIIEGKIMRGEISSEESSQSESEIERCIEEQREYRKLE